MKFTGTLKEPIIDFFSGRQRIVFETEDDFRQTYEEFKDCEKLSIDIKKYRAKRSLDSNAYYWTLVTMLAGRLLISNNEVHNFCLRQYGQPELFDGKGVYMTIPNTEDAARKVDNAMDYHLRPTSQVREGNDGVMYRTYQMLRGSHTYNTEEMSRLISGIISECKAAGIPDAQIATPDEKAQLKEKYGVEL